jgi:hypothetical protein
MPVGISITNINDIKGKNLPENELIEVIKIKAASFVTLFYSARCY